MVDSALMNGDAATYTLPALPDVVHVSTAVANRVPSPGTLRTLKAELGKSWADLMGPDADDADRFQTLAWVTLRRDHPGLRWEQCEDVELIIDDTPELPGPLDPSGSSSATSQASAASGG